VVGDDRRRSAGLPVSLVVLAVPAALEDVKNVLTKLGRQGLDRGRAASCVSPAESCTMAGAEVVGVTQIV
jgi:hypothetical protein